MPNFYLPRRYRKRSPIRRPRGTAAVAAAPRSPTILAEVAAAQLDFPIVTGPPVQGALATSALDAATPTRTAGVLDLPPSADAQAAAPLPTASTNLSSPLRTEILSDAPGGFWLAGEGSGTTLQAQAGPAGTYHGGVDLTVAGHVPGTTAANLDGTSGYADVAHQAAIDIADTFTLECVIALDDPNHSGVVWGKGDNAAQLGYDAANHRYRLNIANVAGDVVVGSTVNDTAWHHLVVVKNGTRREIWLDGADVSTAGTNATGSSTTSALTIGANQGLSEFLDARLQYLALYTSALTGARIQSHFLALGIPAPTADVQAAGPAPTIIPGRNATIAAEVATASADFPLPYWIAPGEAHPQGALAAASVAAPAATVSATGSGPPTNLETAILADSPIGFWKLGEQSGTTATDQIAGHDGTYNGTPTLYQTGFPRINSAAVQLDGTDDYVSIPHNAALNVGDVATIEALVRLDFLLDTDFETLWDKGAGALQIRWDGTNKRWQVNVKGSGNDVAYASVQSNDSNWHHLVVTKNGTTRAIYLDGVNVTTLGTNATAGNTTTPIAVGSSQGSADFLNAAVQYVAYYNYALSGAQVAGHYDALTSNAVVAQLGLTNPPPQIQTATVATIAGTVGAASASAPAPLRIADDTIAATAGAASADGPAATIAAQRSTTIAGAVAAASADGQIAAIITGGNAAVLGIVAASAADAPAATIAAQRQTTIAGTVAAASADALLSTQAATRNPTIAATVATVAADAPLPTIAAQRNTTIAAPTMEVSAAAPAPTIAAQRVVTVAGQVAAASAAALAPTAGAGGGANPVATVASVSADSPAPTISAGTGDTIAAEAAVASADALSPPFMATDATVAALAASGALAALTAAIVANRDATPTATAGAASAGMTPPVIVTAGSTAVSASVGGSAVLALAALVLTEYSATVAAPLALAPVAAGGPFVVLFNQAMPVAEAASAFASVVLFEVRRPSALRPSDRPQAVLIPTSRGG